MSAAVRPGPKHPRWGVIFPSGVHAVILRLGERHGLTFHASPINRERALQLVAEANALADLGAATREIATDDLLAALSETLQQPAVAADGRVAAVVSLTIRAVLVCRRLREASCPNHPHPVRTDDGDGKALEQAARAVS